MIKTKKVLVVFGTRPEAIKMAPICKEIMAHPFFECIVCVTGQHRDMLDTVLDWFEIAPKYDLNLMTVNQNLAEMSANIMKGVTEVINTEKPDVVLVHGDTATTFASSFAAFLSKVPIAHIEAGLRTGDINSPWPEEANRKLTSVITNLHYAPTQMAAQNLIDEGCDEKKITVTGNTVIDALLWTKRKIIESEDVTQKLNEKYGFLYNDKPLILVTIHRRENIGQNIEDLCDSLIEVIRKEDVQILIPVHPNPNVREHITRKLGRERDIYLTEPLPYIDFVYLMMKSRIIITDSGGVQEEAPSLDKPVLVYREHTERPEAIESGAIRLIGTSRDSLINNLTDLIENEVSYFKMTSARNPFGDGLAARLIVSSLDSFLR